MLLTRFNYSSGNQNVEKILQFGEGNFLRGFADWMIQVLNNKNLFNGSVVVVQPIAEGMADVINSQDGLYTLYMRGVVNGETQTNKELVSCISRAVNPYTEYDKFQETSQNADIRFIISNTTESGISYLGNENASDKPQKSFPGKLTNWLYNRYQFFNGDLQKGVIILPCELIDKNGSVLKDIILKLAGDWHYSEDFVTWINKANVFCNTLVDRIVTGYPKDRISEIEAQQGYTDKLVVESELFHLWVIEGPQWIENELPFAKAGLNVIVTDNLQLYRTRKVRILNGAHTSLLPIAYLSGFETVRESIENEVVSKFLNEILFTEIIPSMDIPDEQLVDYAGEVTNRFLNPYIQHFWMSIALNSISKFTARVLPSILHYYKMQNQLPEKLVFSFAALLYFYRGFRGSEPIKLNDTPEIIHFFNQTWAGFDGTDVKLDEIVNAVLKQSDFWSTDLTDVHGMQAMIVNYLKSIMDKGITQSVKELLNSKM